MKDTYIQGNAVIQRGTESTLMQYKNINILLKMYDYFLYICYLNVNGSSIIYRFIATQKFLRVIKVLFFPLRNTTLTIKYRIL